MHQEVPLLLPAPTLMSWEVPRGPESREPRAGIDSQTLMARARPQAEERRGTETCYDPEGQRGKVSLCPPHSRKGGRNYRRQLHHPFRSRGLTSFSADISFPPPPRLLALSGKNANQFLQELSLRSWPENHKKTLCAAQKNTMLLAEVGVSGQP